MTDKVKFGTWKTYREFTSPKCVFLGVDTPVLLVPSLLGKFTFLVSKDSSVTHSSNLLLTARLSELNDIPSYYCGYTHSQHNVRKNTLFLIFLLYLWVLPRLKNKPSLERNFRYEHLKSYANRRSLSYERSICILPPVNSGIK